MEVEVREAPDVLRRQAGGVGSDRGAGRPPQAQTGSCRGHLCPRQLRARGDLRQAPDRASSRRPGRGRRSEHRHHLRKASASAGSVSRHLAIRSSDDLVECAMMAKAAGARTAAVVDHTASLWRRPATSCCPWQPARSSAWPRPRHSWPRSAAVNLWRRPTTPCLQPRSIVCRIGDRRPRCRFERGPRCAVRKQQPGDDGRGPTLAIAREASLKLKETCNLHAEAFSGAEFLMARSLWSPRRSDPDVHAGRRGGPRPARARG